MAEDQSKQDEEKIEFDSAGQALGYISLDQTRVLALRHARNNLSVAKLAVNVSRPNDLEFPMREVQPALPKSWTDSLFCPAPPFSARITGSTRYSRRRSNCGRFRVREGRLQISSDFSRVRTVPSETRRLGDQPLDWIIQMACAWYVVRLGSAKKPATLGLSPPLCS